MRPRPELEQLWFTAQRSVTAHRWSLWLATGVAAGDARATGARAYALAVQLVLEQQQIPLGLREVVPPRLGRGGEVEILKSWQGGVRGCKAGAPSRLTYLQLTFSPNCFYLLLATYLLAVRALHLDVRLGHTRLEGDDMLLYIYTYIRGGNSLCYNIVYGETDRCVPTLVAARPTRKPNTHRHP